MMKWLRKWIRWLMGTDEIQKELVALRLLIATEIERQQPKRNKPMGPLGPVGNR